jgi:stearoyl-CoA desaturase (delta-9 desaturase)
MNQQIVSNSTPAPAKDFHEGIDWVTSVFLFLTPLFGLAGLFYYLSQGGIPYLSWMSFAFFIFATGTGITVGYHRLFSHKSYEASLPVKVWLLFFGAATFQASAIEWCEDHRVHHKFVDTDKDPYSIKKGFWYAHMGWLLQKRKYTQHNVQDLLADPIIKFQHDYYLPIAIFAGFIFPGLLHMLWGSFWEGVLISGALRIAVVHQSTFFINSLCHTFGEQPFGEEQTARNSWWIAILTFGEGYHNFHHEFQADYRNGIRWYDYDPSKWIIRFLSFMHLTRNLREVSDEKILQKSLFLKEKYTIINYQKSNMVLAKEWLEALPKLRSQVMDAKAKFLSLQDEYKQHKSNLKKDEMLTWKIRIEQSKAGFQQSMKSWTEILQSPKTLVV